MEDAVIVGDTAAIAANHAAAVAAVEAVTEFAAQDSHTATATSVERRERR
jgi:hypothetical protein